MHGCQSDFEPLTNIFYHFNQDSLLLTLQSTYPPHISQFGDKHAMRHPVKSFVKVKVNHTFSPSMRQSSHYAWQPDWPGICL